MRLRIDLAYDGRDFHGWAAQPGLRTVQGELETWIGKVLRSAEPSSLTVAGRTDAGVHARGQVCHLDVEGPSPTICDDLLRRLRKVLPDDIVVRNVSPAPDGFDARFSAIWRRYSYRVLPADRVPDPISTISSPSRPNVAAQSTLAPSAMDVSSSPVGTSTMNSLPWRSNAVRCESFMRELRRTKLTMSRWGRAEVTAPL